MRSIKNTSKNTDTSVRVTKQEKKCLTGTLTFGNQQIQMTDRITVKEDRCLDSLIFSLCKKWESECVEGFESV